MANSGDKSRLVLGPRSPALMAEVPATNKKAAPITVEKLLLILPDPHYREQVLSLLNQRRHTSKDLALQIWNSSIAVFILLQEVMSLYKQLSPLRFTMKDSIRVCHALSLFQILATHRDTRAGFIRAKIVVYLYPFISNKGEEKPIDNLRVSCLAVISSLAEIEDEHTPQVIHLLLETELFPLCLTCMDEGTEMTQTLAAFIVSKILMHQQGQNYCSRANDRFFAVACLLATMVDRLPPNPNKDLLRHILSCYLSLSKMARLVRGSDALSLLFPSKLRNLSYINSICDDHAILIMANELLFNLTSRCWSRQEPVITWF